MQFSKLKDLREYEAFTQEEVANILQVDRSTYAGYEIGKDIIPLEKLNELANLYHTSLDYLVGNTPTKEDIKFIQEINRKTVAHNIKNFRDEHNLTQKKLAKVLNTSQPNISNYEKAEYLITTTYALQFVKQYQYSLDKLVGRKKETTNKNH